MRIPSGDLAPARKRRRGYGRRRNPLPVLLAVLLVAAVAVGAYLIQRGGNDGPSTPAAAACTPAPKPSPAASPKAPAKAAPVKAAPVKLPAPGQVAMRLLNGTTRAQLARTVGNELARRGFRVAGMGNAPSPLTGPSRIYYGPGGRPAALLVSAHVLGAQVIPVPKAVRGSIDVVLGSTFVRLRTAPEVTAFARQLAAGSVPAAPKPTAAAPVPSPTCR